MTDDLTHWTGFDPQALPELPEGEEEGRVVALVTAPGASEWGGELAVKLAEGWSDAGRRVVLADGGVAEARLREILDVSPGEGVTDAILYGASVRRVVVPVAGAGFFFIRAGTVAARTEGLLAQPRWAQLCQAFREARVTLLVFLSGEEVESLGGLETATDMIVLASEGEDLPALVGDDGPPLRAVVGLSDGEASEVAPEGAADDPGFEAEGDEPAVEEPADDPGFEAGDDELAMEEPVEDAVTPAVGDDEPAEAEETPAAPDEDGGSEETAEADASARMTHDEVAPEKRPSNRRRTLLLILLLAILAALGAAWLGYIEIPMIGPLGSASIMPAVPATLSERIGRLPE